jgi:hypothetical protein
MTWALYAPMEDMTAIVAGITEVAGLTPQERNRLRDYWQGGLNQWQTAPCIPTDHPCWATDGVASTVGGTCMRVIVCTHGTLADFRALVAQIQEKNPAATVFRFFEPFMGNGWFAVDPYPPPAGYFTGRTCT